MNRPRSRDLRERALGHLDAGRPVAEVAATRAALDAVTAQDAAGCSADGGYPLTSHAD